MTDADAAEMTITEAHDLAVELRGLRAWKAEVTAEEKKVTARLRTWLEKNDYVTLDDGKSATIQHSAPSKIYAPERLSDADLLELVRIPGLFKVDGATLRRMAANSDHLAIHHLRETEAPGSSGGSIKVVFE